MTIGTPGIEELAEKNMRKWMLAEHSRKRMEAGSIKQSIGPFIVISRETGAGGSEIARLVGEQLSWDVLDREIIDCMSEKYGTPRDLLEFVDEKRVRWMEEVLGGWLSGQRFAQAAYVQRLSQLFLAAATHGNVVIVGRGAQFILPHDRGLSVRILAPLEFRIEQVILQQGITEAEARQFVTKKDHDRNEFVKNYFRHSPADPHMHDLVINVEKLVRDDAVKLIVAAAQAWLKKSAAQSQETKKSPEMNHRKPVKSSKILHVDAILCTASIAY